MRVFRAINKAGRVWGDGMTPKVLWAVVNAAAVRADIEKLAPHDPRRTCARLRHLAGGELDRIQFLLGHLSIQTTERCLECKQKLRQSVIVEPATLQRRPDARWHRGSLRRSESLGDRWRLLERCDLDPRHGRQQSAEYALLLQPIQGKVIYAVPDVRARLAQRPAGERRLVDAPAGVWQHD